MLLGRFLNVGGRCVFQTSRVAKLTEMYWKLKKVGLLVAIGCSGILAWGDERTDSALVGVGDLAGGEFLSHATAISADGSTVVGYSESSNGIEAFRWIYGKITGLGALSGDSFHSLARDVSADGSVVVGDSRTSAGIVAFRWENGEMIGLGELPGGAVFSDAFGVSGDGSVVVGQSDSGSGREAFKWYAGELISLGGLSGANRFSQAFDVSADGSLIVGHSQSETGREAFRFRSGGMEALGDLPGGKHAGVAQRVSADGSTIVGYGASVWGTQATVWRNGEVRSLGAFSQHNVSSFARDVTSHGDIVVGMSINEADRPEAFIWTETGGMRRLADILSVDFGIDLNGWVLQDATGISSDGSVVVGDGINPAGQTEAWIAFMPRLSKRSISGEEISRAGMPFRFGTFRVELKGLLSPGDIAIGKNGNVYVADTGHHRVRVFDSSGNSVSNFGQRGSGEGELISPQGVALGQDIVFVSDTGNHHVQVFDVDGKFLRMWGHFGQDYGAFNRPTDIVVDGNNVYVVDSLNHRVQVFDFDGTFRRSVGSFGNGPDQLCRPAAVAVDSGGSLYVADAGNKRVRKFSAGGEPVGSWENRGIVGGLPFAPAGLASHVGEILVVDEFNDRVQFIKSSGNPLMQWSVHGVFPHEGHGRVHRPGQLAIAPSGLFAGVCEPFENRCQLFSASEGANGSAGFTREIEAQFGPRIAVHGNRLAVSQPETGFGLIYDISKPAHATLVTQIRNPGGDTGAEIIDLKFDRQQSKLVAMDVRQSRLTFFRARSDEAEIPKYVPNLYSFAKAIDLEAVADSIPAEFRRCRVSPIAFQRDSKGNWFILDETNAIVLVFDKAMSFRRAIYHRDGNRLGPFSPVDLAIDRAGRRVYVVDADRCRVEMYDADTGKHLSGWGSWGDKPGQFRRPMGITVGIDGTVYVTDAGAHNIQKFSATGEFQRRIGSRGIGPGEFFKPIGIAQDDKGRLFVVDYGNHRIQVLASDGAFENAIGPAMYVLPATSP